MGYKLFERKAIQENNMGELTIKFNLDAVGIKPKINKIKTMLEEINKSEKRKNNIGDCTMVIKADDKLIKYINNGKSNMSRIMSDVTKRTLIVEGYKEVERIQYINQGDYIFKVKAMDNDMYKIELIYKVGDYCYN